MTSMVLRIYPKTTVGGCVSRFCFSLFSSFRDTFNDEVRCALPEGISPAPYSRWIHLKPPCRRPHFDLECKIVLEHAALYV